MKTKSTNFQRSGNVHSIRSYTRGQCVRALGPKAKFITFNVLVGVDIVHVINLFNNANTVSEEERNKTVINRRARVIRTIPDEMGFVVEWRVCVSLRARSTKNEFLSLSRTPKRDVRGFVVVVSSMDVISVPLCCVFSARFPINPFAP